MKKISIIIIVLELVAILLIINKLYVNNYAFKLNGSDELLLNLGDTWQDPLYTVRDNYDIKITNNIDYTKEGDYEVIYSLKIGLFTKKLTRKVKIVSKNEKTDFTFKLKGDNPYYLMKNHSYKETGYIAYDENDGDLNNSIEISDNIDKNKDGNYEIKYQVKNSDGIIKTIIRKIIVYSFSFNGALKTHEYSKDNDIFLNINDENYKHSILPNGNITTDRQITYHVNENNNYEFKLYDINNNYFLYSVNVTTIDNEKPTGYCYLSLLDNNGEITVNAKDNTELDGYIYEYGKTKTSLITSKTLKIDSMDENASITIYDKAGNSNDIICQTVDNSTKYTREYKLETYNFNGTKKQYWLYKPNRTKRQVLPLIIYFHGDGGNSSYNAVNSVSLPKNIKDGKDFPYYIVAPYKGTNSDFAIDLINYLVKNNNIDNKRIIISGGSSGSPAALSIAAQNQNMFSSIVIISGVARVTTVNTSNLINLPIWFFQGISDNYSTISNYVKEINDAGGNARITSYKGGHNAPVDAFLREDLTNWILTNYSQKEET